LNDGNAGALWGHFTIFGANSREKHAAEPVQFGAPPAFCSSFGDRFRVTYLPQKIGSD